jgi:hypothetical protein
MTPEFVNRIFNARSYKHHVVQTDKWDQNDIFDVSASLALK